MRIRQGVTGFDSAAQVGSQSFKSACYDVARQLDASVSSFNVAAIVPNFHVAALALRGESMAILCNSIYPLIAFAEPLSDGACEIRFRSHSEAAEAFMRSGEFNCLTPEELNARVSDVDLSELSHDEMEQVRYWQPRTLGALVYNWWD